MSTAASSSAEIVTVASLDIAQYKPRGQPKKNYSTVYSKNYKITQGYAWYCKNENRNNQKMDIFDQPPATKGLLQLSAWLRSLMLYCSWNNSTAQCCPSTRSSSCWCLHAFPFSRQHLLPLIPQYLSACFVSFESHTNARLSQMGWNSYDSYELLLPEDEFWKNVNFLAANVLSSGWEYAVVDEGTEKRKENPGRIHKSHWIENLIFSFDC